MNWQLVGGVIFNRQYIVYTVRYKYNILCYKKDKI